MDTKCVNPQLLRSKDEIEAAVMARLQHHGWIQDRIVSNLAIKDFHTPQNAGVWFYPNPDEYAQYWLRCDEFMSAGESVLATCWAIIPGTADNASIDALVDAFAADAERRVAASFAGRFLRHYTNKKPPEPLTA